MGMGMGMAWYDIIGMSWYGMVWHGMAQYDMVWFNVTLDTF